MKPLAIAVGDPAGVGPLVTMRALASRPPAGGAIVIGSARQLGALARELGAPLAGCTVEDAGDVDHAVVTAHAPTREGGRAQLVALERAMDAVATGRARALVTGPVSKEAIVLAGTPFVGQTEHLARRAGLAADAVSMLFIGPRLRVGLVTTHASLRDVPEAITLARVVRTGTHLADALGRLDGARVPRIAVLGLNPHAGEGGLFGREELDVITPAVAALRAGPIGARAAFVGPLPAESALRGAADGAYDGVVAMFHDQATIASKLLDWGAAVNVTWGLPIVRTSVDHGVAYDAARRGVADEAGMAAAIDLAARLTT